MSTAPLDPKCPGAHDMRGIVSMCICCGRKDAKSTASPPAVRLESGLWRCDALVPPAGWPKP